MNLAAAYRCLTLWPKYPGSKLRRENGINLSAREYSLAFFYDLQTVCHQLTSMGEKLTRTRSNSHSVGVYFNDPDGDSNEVYFEAVEAFRRRPQEGEYHRKLEGIAV